MSEWVKLRTLPLDTLFEDSDGGFWLLQRHPVGDLDGKCLAVGQGRGGQKNFPEDARVRPIDVRLLLDMVHDLQEESGAYRRGLEESAPGLIKQMEREGCVVYRMDDSRHSAEFLMSEMERLGCNGVLLIAKDSFPKKAAPQ